MRMGPLEASIIGALYGILTFQIGIRLLALWEIMKAKRRGWA